MQYLKPVNQSINCNNLFAWTVYTPYEHKTLKPNAMYRFFAPSHFNKTEVVEYLEFLVKNGLHHWADLKQYSVPINVMLNKGHNDSGDLHQ